MHIIKVYTVSRGTTLPIINFGTRWRWGVSFVPRPPHLRGKARGVHWTQGCTGCTVGLYVLQERKSLSPDRTPDRALPGLVPNWYL
jgi:hypothetical protein